MSHIDARFATNTVTVWRSAEDKYGQETWSRVGTFNAEYKIGSGNAIDNMGKTYTPKAVFFCSNVSIVSYNDIIALGDIAGDNPISLGYRDRVRTIQKSSGSCFGWSDSVQIMVA